MFVRTLTYIRLKTSTPFIRDYADADQLTLMGQIDQARNAAAGFVSETESVSDDQLKQTFVDTWQDAASFNAFYAANEAIIDQHTAFKAKYSALMCVGITDNRKTV